MPRRIRDEEPGAIHHVVPQGNGRRPIALDDRDRHAYLARFHRAANDHDWTIHASTLLDTHHHAVIETDMPNLGAGMKRVLGGHAHWFNARHGTRGAVFAERFWSARVYDAGHLLRACLYTLLNPVAAGLARHPRDWPWSSYRLLDCGGCSPRLGEALSEEVEEATTRLLELLDEGAERLCEMRRADRDSTLCLVAELGARHVQGAAKATAPVTPPAQGRAEATPQAMCRDSWPRPER